ncbi:hypothetical protein K443DRAFT_678066 [Laccaria amethystina LaAM-08-1]|uniref:Unplaced genomic scaffold K443scaffold_65, whole genome shotgun sequence n=1 Tax=Laccaria amethystina LaAM-08-1 TaxID=1095629 RepID=A0A0C9Y1I6_9AGAR|nr:hypothetical protein K443DRAFT_678066 [Laccaria amethystina LaAM-08-1]
MPRERITLRSRSRSPSRSPRRRDDRHGARDNVREDRRRSPPRSRQRSLPPTRRRTISRSPPAKFSRRYDSRSRSRSKDRRKRSRSPSPERKEKKKRDCSVLTSSDSDDSSSKRKREKRKHKDGKRSQSKERRREKKREKKEKREKKKRTGTSAPHWGKYGIISESDIFTRTHEFYTWLVEERKINPETITKDQQKKEFSRFVEDFNTATLPHEKYYNMEAYEKRMSALRQGEYLPPPDDSYDPEADMKAITGAHKRKPIEHDSYMSKEQLMQLRKVQHERIEAGKMKLLGMDVKQNMGVRMDGTMFDG